MKIIKQNDSNIRRNYYPIRSIFDDFFTPNVWEDFTAKTPLANVWEENENVYVEMAVPGVEKKDLNITITEDTICISGVARSEEEKDSKKRYYYKSMENSFEQRFNLPTKVDSKNSTAELKNGIVHLTLPKANEVKPKTIEIK